MNEKRIIKIKNQLQIVSIILTITLMATNVYAATDDPIGVVNNLSNFIFSILKGVGLIILGFSVLQFGLAIKAHDPSQRDNSVLGIFGGIIIYFSKEILNIITGS